VTFTSAIPNPDKATPPTITVLGTTAAPIGLASFYTDSGMGTKVFDVPKANWNYELVAQDGSRGVHNPSFTFNVLSATLSALNNGALTR
jgi:hypothetical protein